MISPHWPWQNVILGLKKNDYGRGSLFAVSGKEEYFEDGGEGWCYRARLMVSLRFYRRYSDRLS